MLYQHKKYNGGQLKETTLHYNLQRKGIKD